MVDDSGVVTELEGDWHRVAHITKWGTERRPVNMRIRANQWTGTIWTGKSTSGALVVDADMRTIDFGSQKIDNSTEIISARDTYELNDDVLTIHSEYTITDLVSGALSQKGQNTNIWKRGLCEIPDYDGRNPGNGMGLFYLNGNDENTGHGKLIPGNKVDVLVSLKLQNGTPQQCVLAENLEVDGSSEPTENRERQISLQGTLEQCLLLQNTPKQETMSLRTRKPNDETLQFPDGINREAFKELDAAASHKTLDVASTELEGDWHLVSITDKAGDPVEVRPVNLSFRNDRYTLAYQGGQTDRRIEVYPDQKEIRYFEDGEVTFAQSKYILDSNQLTILDESQKRVYHRDHVRLPKSIPEATEEQKARWRSGVVEVMVQPRQNNADLRVSTGNGVIVSPQGLIVAQVKLSGVDLMYFAKFDDGGLIPLKIVEEGRLGWVTFQPEQSIEVNHHFQLSAAAIGQNDEVNFWGRSAKVSDQPTPELFTSHVTALDRKSHTGSTV
ncbi:MAG: hypothetical protein WKF77_15535 [Planctomycetaceae bacterium]